MRMAAASEFHKLKWMDLGGPGSGRRPGFGSGLKKVGQGLAKAGTALTGKPVHDEMHKTLTDNGFQHLGNKMGYYGSMLPRKGLMSQYVRQEPDGGHTSASTHGSGSWHTHQWRSDGAMGTSTSGASHASLLDHLKSFGKGMAKVGTSLSPQ